MMDQPLQPTFVRQKSKAIPIINPKSGVITTVKKPTSTLPPPVHPTSKSSNTKSALRTRISAEAELEDDSATEDEGRVFNVYARPYVPEHLTIINTRDGRKIDTPAMNQINFEAYSRKYLGMDFLPPIPQPVGLPMDVSYRLNDDHYELYFRYHLEAEIRSQEQENESYSLYGHDASVLSQETGDQVIVTFVVPGLRENSPYVEEDDAIQLRELCYGHEGRLLLMAQWQARKTQLGIGAPAPAPTAWRWGDEATPGWTGIVCNARVSAVQRKHEQLLVRVRGIIAPKRHLKLNIQFPTPMRRFISMRHVLPIIQRGLTEVRDNRCENVDGTKDEACATPSITSPASYSSPQPEGVFNARRHWFQSMLFPIEANCDAQTKLGSGTFTRPFFDEQLNWEQRKAVESICSQNYGTLPFLISGPPGTGKTKTLVETALQFVNNVDAVSHILFCAPSDPAADTLVQRLSAHLKPAEMLRLNRPSRTFAEVSERVLPFCYISQNIFNLPPFKSLMSFKIVVTTCRDASLLLHSRMTNSDLYASEHGLCSSIHPYRGQPQEIQLHWTAILIDEAAQAMEPEAVIPLSVVAPPSESTKLAFRPLFVMAGDEHQLGPRTSMRFSPLKTSLFGRLFARAVYANHPLARDNARKAPPALNRAMLPILRPAFANLIRNYRSHPAILAVPSALFYADTLVPEATGTARLASWSEWRGKRWPVLFHENSSKDELEEDGGGWYNVGEAKTACLYAAHLVQSGLVEQNEVCIMSPFKAQVQRIRKTIRDPQYGSLWNVDVGPTEAFQGLERGVVILCTTRSKLRFLDTDKKLDWGIIGTPDKMNVAITRAKFGLIVIGRRKILHQDPNWTSFVDFCDRNGLATSKNDRGTATTHIPDTKLTRLEKVLLAQERDSEPSRDSRALRGTSLEDEMWTAGIQAALDMESIEGIGYCNGGEQVDK